MPLSVLKIRHSNIGCWHWVPIYPELLPSKIKDICWEFSVSVINVCFYFSLRPVFFSTLCPRREEYEEEFEEEEEVKQSEYVF